MKFSEHRLTEDYQSNGLDMGCQTVTHRHHAQKWQYQYPRHLRPHFSTLCKQETISHHPHHSPVIIHQGSRSQVCPISTQPTETVAVNEVTKIHLQNLCRNLEQRLKKAQMQGDEGLISLLEKEWQDISPFCVI
ncbi:hypothetical protein [Crocosphaera sp.]|uniref:hypothetical protein n=1 Tax=Crocosphaera sp. TaxID=2729996 RepID=UPI003F20225F|nr:hypothetical protein [Crocosphaera sp.]